MRLPFFLLDAIRRRCIATTESRAPDFIIGGPEDPYLKRWWLLPRNPIFNVYLHRLIRSDDDRALHDHPWLNCSIILRGCYFENTIAAGGIWHRRLRIAGDIKLRRPRSAHRLEVLRGSSGATTLFITGPRIREWGFHCPDVGWRHWKIFTSDDDKGQIGRGCE